MRAIGHPIHVQTQHGQPTQLCWNNHTHPITHIHDTWRWAGRWWLSDPPRDYWLLGTPTLTAEIYRATQHGHTTWWLSRMQD